MFDYNLKKKNCFSFVMTCFSTGEKFPIASIMRLADKIFPSISSNTFKTESVINIHQPKLFI